MSYLALVVGVGTTAYSVIKGSNDAKHKREEAAKLTASTVRPYYNKPKEIGDVYNLNVSEINDTGLQDYASQQSDESEANGIDAILKSGGKADFSTIHNTYGRQLGQALQAIKTQRANNIAKFNESAYAQGRADDAEFSYNRDQPYKDAKQLSALLNTQAAEADANATNNLVSGVADVGIATLKAGTKAKWNGNSPNPDLLSKDNIKSAVDEPFNIRSMGERFQPSYIEPQKTTTSSTLIPPPKPESEMNTEELFDNWYKTHNSINRI